MLTGVGSLVLVSVMGVYAYSSRWFLATANYVDLDRKSQVAVDRLSQQIRQASQLTSYNSTNLTFQDFDGQTLKFNYDATAQTLTRVKTNASDIYLYHLDSLQFLIYQRNVQAGTLDAVSTGTATNCKLVEINWTTSRTMLGLKANTESLRSAKVVLRKK